MFSTIRRLLGAIRVYEDKDLIHIEGLPAKVVMRDIFEVWSTSKIASYMFNHVDSSSISFNKFFAPDVAYALEEITRQRRTQHHHRALKQIVELLYENTWLKTTREEYPDILNFDRFGAMNVKPLDTQWEFLHTYNKQVPCYQLQGYLLGAAPGTGKTLAGIFLNQALETDVMISIVPKNAVERVWEDTISSVFKNPVKYWVSTSGKAPEPGCSHYVFHYEQLEQAVAFFKQHKPSKPMIFLDECHNLNDMSSARTQLFIELCRITNAQHVVWASGTPVKAIGNEVMPLLMTLDKFFSKDAQERFKQIFGKNASRAVDILRNRLGMMTFKVDKKAAVGNDVQEKEIRIKIPNGDKYTLEAIREEMRKFIAERMDYYQNNMKRFVKFYEECIKEHEKTVHGQKAQQEFKLYRSYVHQIRNYYDPVAMKDMVMMCNKYELKVIIPSLPQSLRDEFKDVRSIYKYYQLKVQGEALGRILGKQRAQCIVDMVPYFDWAEVIDTAVKKTLIFTSFVNVVDAIEKTTKDLGYAPLKVYGDTNKDLSGIIGRYEKEKDTNPLVATYKSLSTAVPLIMANVVVLFNSPFREYEREQAVSRVDRLGQDETVWIITVLLDTGTEPNISTRSNDILNWSKEQVDAIMGTKTAGLDISLESFEELVGFNETDFKLNDGQAQPQPAWGVWSGMN